MPTRTEIIEILIANSDKTKDEKQTAVSVYLDSQSVSADDKAKIIADLESYAEY